MSTNKIKLLLEELITEASPKEIYDKYYSDFDEKDFKRIVTADPRTKVIDGEIKKIGNYAKLLLAMFKKGTLKLEDLPKATEYLEIAYTRHIGIPNSVTDLTDIYDLVKGYIVSDGETDINKIMSTLNTGQDYELVHNGEDWYIFIPKTEVGACRLGSDTQWCTTWGQNSTNPAYKGRSSMFANYHRQGKIYTMVNKADNALKYQFHLESNQYMDKNDRQVNIDDFMSKYKELYKFFVPEIFGDLDKLGEADLRNLVNDKLVTSNDKNGVIKYIINKHQGNTAIEALLNARENDDYDEINGILSESGAEYSISTTYREKLTLDNFEDESLHYIGNLGYNDYDNYVEDDEIDNYYNAGLTEFFNKHNDEIEYKFNEEQVDIKRFSNYLNSNGERVDEFGESFVEELLKEYGDIDDIKREISSTISSARGDAETEKGREIASDLNKIINANYQDAEVDFNIFSLFLLDNPRNRSIESFKDYIRDTFGVYTEYYTAEEDVREYSYNNGDVKMSDIVDIFKKEFSDNIVTDFLSNWEEELVEFNHENSDNPEDFENISGDDYHQKLRDFKEKLETILSKSVPEVTPRSHYVTKSMDLTLYPKKINIFKDLIYIKFIDLGDNTNLSFEGYAKLEDLPRYLSYGYGSKDFLQKLHTILKNMGVNPSDNEFENERFKIKLNYKNFDVETNRIDISLTDKTTGKTLSGMVDIEELPNHFRNYKIFETVAKFKRLL